MANQAGYYIPGLGGNGSLQVNGQLVPMPMANAFFPNMAIAPSYTGSGQPPPTVPLSYMGGNGNQQAASAAAANPWSPTQSPLWVAVIALVVGFLGLRYVHWRG